MASRLLPLRRLSRLMKLAPSLSTTSSFNYRSHFYLLLAFKSSPEFSEKSYQFHSVVSSRRFCARPSDLVNDDSRGPAAIDYHSILQEEDFHRLADSTIHGLQEKLEEYGDAVDIDGFDVDYGNGVLTLKLGDHGTYVINKQTPNRQIWTSSPVSGPSRFDWDHNAQAWIYRRNKANLSEVLETELEQLCGEPINLT